jgi:hypothetical protein
MLIVGPIDIVVVVVVERKETEVETFRASVVVDNQ